MEDLSKKGEPTAASATRSEVWVPLLLALIMPLFFYYYGQKNAYELFFSGSGAELSADGIFYEFLFGLLFFSLIPVLTWTAVLGKPLSSLGFGAGSWKKGLISALFLLPFILGYAYLAGRIPEFQLRYPRFNYIGMESTAMMLRYYGAAFLFFWARDLFYRGFLVQGLKGSLGRSGSVFVSALAAAPMYTGAGIFEGTAGLIISVLYGWVAVRSGSFLYTAVLSFVWFLTLEMVLIYGF